MDRRCSTPRRRIGVAAIVGLTAFAASDAPAPAQQQGAPQAQVRTLSVNGSARVKPTPRDRKSNDSIRRAVKVARNEATPKALDDGRARAAALASQAGLPLGALISIAETTASPFGYFGPFGDDGTFGPGRYCGTVRRSVFRTDAQGRRKRVGSRSSRSCRIPPFVGASLTLVFAVG